MRKVNNAPLQINKKNKLEEYFKNWDNNEETKKECLIYLFKEALNAEEIKSKAISPILKRVGHLLAGEKELRKNLKSLETINELTKEWLEDNIEGCLEEKMEVEDILTELSEHLQSFLKIRAISEIKTGVELAQ